jgi:hypothetical protein
MKFRACPDAPVTTKFAAEGDFDHMAVLSDPDDFAEV